VLDALSREIGAARVRTHVSLNIGRSSLLDPGGLGRAIEAIVRNAIEAVEGCPDAEIAVTTAPVPEGFLVEVRDNGIGMARDTVPRIFDPFFSIGKRGNMGLGLALARRTVERLRGHVEVRSEEGRGTSVWIVIPSDLRQSLIPRERRSSSPPAL
jgi:two-component system sporulation sensor kinase B